MALPRLAQAVSDLWNKSRDEAHVAEQAKLYLEWSQKEYHQTFLKWLEEQALAPVKAKSEFELLTGNARVNTMREIRHYLIEQAKKAQAALSREWDG